MSMQLSSYNMIVSNKNLDVKSKPFFSGHTSFLRSFSRTLLKVHSHKTVRTNILEPTIS